MCIHVCFSAGYPQRQEWVWLRESYVQQQLLRFDILSKGVWDWYMIAKKEIHASLPRQVCDGHRYQF